MEVNRYARKIGNIGPQDLVDVASTADGKRLWALTRRGGIVASIDSGETWKEQGKIDVHTNFTSIAASDDGGSLWVISGTERDQSGSGKNQFFSSQDGGLTWRELGPGLDNFPYQSHVRSMSFNRALKRLFLVGEEGTIRYTQDNGKTWYHPHVAKREGDARALKRLAFADDGQIGWAVGEDIVLTSTDGGSSWQHAESAEAEGRRLLHSENNRPVALQRFNSVQTDKDGREVWITTDDSDILHSTDGGRSWETKQATIGLSSPEIFVSNENKRRWLFDGESVESNGLFETNDVGLPWHLHPKTRDFHINKMLGVGSYVLAVGGGGTILKLDRESEAFKTKASSVGLNIHELNINSQVSSAWFISDRGTWRSRDHGETWNLDANLRDLGEGYELQSSVHFDPSGRNGYVLGSKEGRRTYLAKTVDGGETWQEFSPQLPPKNEREELFFTAFKPRALLMSRDGLRLLSYDNTHLFASSDGGKNWVQKWPVDVTDRQLTDDLDLGFCRASFKSHMVGDVWVMREQSFLSESYYCQLLAKQKRAHSDSNKEKFYSLPQNFPLKNLEVKNESEQAWIPSTKENEYHIRSVVFSENGKLGIALSTHSSKFVMSEDGGEHWREYSAPTTSQINTVRFSSDEQEIWAVGERNAMFSSRDNGKTWEEKGKYQRLPPPWFYLMCTLAAVILISGIALGYRNRRLRETQTSH